MFPKKICEKHCYVGKQQHNKVLICWILLKAKVYGQKMQYREQTIVPEETE